MMKHIKKLSFLLLLLFCTNMIAAQTIESVQSEEAETVKIDALAEKINLTDKQLPEFRVITRKYANRIQEIEKSEGRAENKVYRIEKLKATQKEELKQLLNKEQMALYETNTNSKSSKKKIIRSSSEN